MTEREIKSILAIISQERHADRNRAMFMMSILAGMRVGEIALLKLCDVISESGKVKDQIYLNSFQTKGHTGRTVYLSDKLKNELVKYIKTVDLKKTDAPFFYSQRRVGGFSPNTLCQHFKKIYEKAGICGASSHSGRRSYITNLANKGVGVRVLMALAGHKDMSTTQRYIDVNDNMIKAAINLI